MKVGFTPKQVTRLTGVPYSTLNLWANKGLVRPSVAEGLGSGSERVYSVRDLVALKVAFALRKAGVTTRSLEKVVQFLRNSEGMDYPLAEARLIVTGRDVVVANGDRELVSALSQPGQSCLSFVVDLPQTLGELDQLVRSTDAFAVGLADTTRTEDTSKHNGKRPVSTTRAEQRRVRQVQR